MQSTRLRNTGTDFRAIRFAFGSFPRTTWPIKVVMKCSYWMVSIFPMMVLVLTMEILLRFKRLIPCPKSKLAAKVLAVLPS